MTTIKKLFIGFILLPIPVFSQVIISPYIVFTDQSNRFGSFIVQNESSEIYEVTISFKFGYPVSDSLGTLTMEYIENPPPGSPSIVDWVRAFPRKFILKPKQRQTVRMSIKPPAGINSGTYWARIFTSSTPQSAAVDSVSKGVTAQIRFVLNQVTTLMFRMGEATTGIDVKDIKVIRDSNNVNILSNVERTGNSPFIGNMLVTLSDTSGEIVSETTEYLSLYYQLVKKVSFGLDTLSSGKYKAELTFISNEKEDIPQSNLHPISPVIKTIELNIP